MVGLGRGGKCLHLPDSLRPEAAAQLSCTECQTVPVRLQVSHGTSAVPWYKARATGRVANPDPHYF
jgi:hypothetical protein